MQGWLQVNVHVWFWIIRWIAGVFDNSQCWYDRSCLSKRHPTSRTLLWRHLAGHIMAEDINFGVFDKMQLGFAIAITSTARKPEKNNSNSLFRSFLFPILWAIWSRHLWTFDPVCWCGAPEWDVGIVVKVMLILMTQHSTCFRSFDLNHDSTLNEALDNTRRDQGR